MEAVSSQSGVIAGLRLKDHYGYSISISVGKLLIGCFAGGCRLKTEG